MLIAKKIKIFIGVVLFLTCISVTIYAHPISDSSSYNSVIKPHKAIKTPSQNNTQLEEPKRTIKSTQDAKSESKSEKGNSSQREGEEILEEAQESPYGISFYEPTYALPFYYTGSPYEAVYRDSTPDNQRILPEEFKGQLSFKFPIWAEMFGSNFTIAAYYTQLSYWQFYAKSQYFRETDYEPAVYINYDFLPHWSVSSGLDHQSNGRGGQLERSWNRVFFDLVYYTDHWYVSIKPWFLVFKSESTDLHNPNITDFLGYGRIVIAYKFYDQEISFMVRNAVESGFSRGAVELDYSFPIHGVLHGYIQFFSGYGQSLIEYDHYTNSVGVGIAISNWI